LLCPLQVEHGFGELDAYTLTSDWAVHSDSDPDDDADLNDADTLLDCAVPLAQGTITLVHSWAGSHHTYLSDAPPQSFILTKPPQK
jgi:hypothetical protein